MERDTRVIHAADGALAAFAQHSTPGSRAAPIRRVRSGRHRVRGAWARIGDHRMDGGGDACPARPGFDGPTVELRAGRTTTARSRLFDTYGYTAIRSFWQMAMDLDESFDCRRGARGRDDPTGRDGRGRPGCAIGAEHGVPVAFRPRRGDVRGVAGAAGGRRHLGSHPRACSPRSTGRSSASATTG